MNDVDGGAPDLVFYDGECGFCHRSVRWLLERDEGGGRFRFAPIGGPTFEQEIPAAERASLPDTLVVRTAAGRTLSGSDAVVHVLRRLGGRHARRSAWLARVPRPLRDAVYAAFARMRRGLLARPEAACPLVPPELRARFLA